MVEWGIQMVLAPDSNVLPTLLTASPGRPEWGSVSQEFVYFYYIHYKSH